MRTCKLTGCDGPSRSRGYCGRHYQQIRKGKAPTLAGPPSVAERLAMRSEWRGDCLIWTGANTDAGYGQMSAGNKVKHVHRLAWELVNGPIPEGMKIDHRCWNPACINVKHLRMATNSENMKYRPGPPSNSTTGVRNVATMKGGRFQVKLTVDGRAKYIGHFDSLDDASKAAEFARQKYYGEFAGRGRAA